MSINKVNTNCVGCGVCQLICPFNAVSLKDNNVGFQYPYVDNDLCTECGICEKKCPALNTSNKQNLKKAYYGRSLDEDIVLKSSSGGIFSEIAKKVLSEKGVVFGAVFDEKNKEIIYSNTDKVSLEQLRRSKYSESKIKNSFNDAKNYLDSGRKVLFVGTPCHISALKLFLGVDYDNLITCDFICGGAASPVFFKQHLEFLEKKYKSSISDVNFRPKLYGWSQHSIKIDFKNGKTYKKSAYLDSYFRGFIFEGVIKRDICADCNFRNNHVSDIILADFWGYKQIKDIKNDEKGLSLIVTNSEKGEEIINSISGNTSDIHEIPLEYASYNFKLYKNPQQIKSKKKEFVEMYKEIGFEKASKKMYMKGTFKFKLKRIIKKILKRGN